MRCSWTTPEVQKNSWKLTFKQKSCPEPQCNKVGETERCWAPIRKFHTFSLMPSPISTFTTEFSQLSPSHNELKTGLFDCPEFSISTQFALETKKCIQRSRLLVAEMTNGVEDPDVSIIDKMDLLSDELCRVADLSECIRQVHPDQEVTKAAECACLTVNTFVEELNTNVDLYMALDNFMKGEKFLSMDRVTQRTAEVFMHDFEISGIHLKDSLRKEVVELNRKLLEVGYKYVLSTSEPSLVKIESCLPDFKSHYNKHKGYYCVDHVPYHSSNMELRKQAYLLYYGQDDEKLEFFEEVICKRQKLAKLVGYPSFSHRVLKMSMAKYPERVLNFLEHLSEKVLPLAKEDLQQLQDQAKAKDIGPWDIPLLISGAQKACLPQGLSSLKNWFPLDTCIDGLRKLFQSLFGVRLEVSPVKRGEVWHPSVYKFCFFDENENLLGCTYADLMNRRDKLASDCHFTIRGGRELEISFSDGTDTSTSTGYRGYQLPIITLCCSIEWPRDDTKPCLLSQHSVETLFHEMGHALHSMLGRVKYQNVTGTRCCTDFAEVPSILMEFFLYDERVVSTFAKHHKSGEGLPPSLLKAFQLSAHFLPAYDTQHQIYNAFVDQRFHSHLASFPPKPTGWSSQIYQETTEEFSPLGYTPGSSYYLRFPHLCSYGGRYYSYLWSRAVASLIWQSSFQSDPFSRASGERYRAMLSYGGGVSPHVLVRDMLGFEPSVEELVGALYTDILRQREEVQRNIQ